MELGIIGLPKSGKTTVFNAVTKGKAKTAAYSTGTIAPNIGVVKVPDSRIQPLVAMFDPKKTTPAEVKYIDIGAPPKGFGKGEGISGEFLAHISRADALIHVVRVFDDADVPHVNETIDPERDIDAMELELAFSDMAIIERKMDRTRDALKGAKTQERDAILKEQNLLEKVKLALEEGQPIRKQNLTDQESGTLANYKFLTAKPMLIILNIGENDLDQTSSLEERFRSQYHHQTSNVVALCGKLEMELTQLDDDEAKVFREDMGIEEAGLNRAIALSYKLLGFISFFTVGPDEVKAWTIRKDTVAQEAAGKIHSDLERGFIRAEVIGWSDLVECGSMAAARTKGLLRLEGKSYIVQDGDVLTILFNV
ncbi:MAG: redox-regulated ATPase YchF [Chloroflexota bacterium]|nr:redox-regulated ATPase YchF [Chloroflexota bacterium]